MKYIHQGLKPEFILLLIAARLKSSPDTKLIETAICRSWEFLIYPTTRTQAIRNSPTAKIASFSTIGTLARRENTS